MSSDNLKISNSFFFDKIDGEWTAHERRDLIESVLHHFDSTMFRVSCPSPIGKTMKVVISPRHSDEIVRLAEDELIIYNKRMDEAGKGLIISSLEFFLSGLSKILISDPVERKKIIDKVDQEQAQEDRINFINSHYSDFLNNALKKKGKFLLKLEGVPDYNLRSDFELFKNSEPSGKKSKSTRAKNV